MKSFSDWTRDLAESLRDNEILDNPQAPLLTGDQEELCHYNKGLDLEHWSWPCRVCQKDTPIWCEIEEFDPSKQYCGGSPSCCP